MAITLDAITLPEDLSWTDEYAWSPVVQNAEFSLTGALILEEATRQAGCPFTLQSPDGGAWTTRATADGLRAKLAANTSMTLTLHTMAAPSPSVGGMGRPPWKPRRCLRVWPIPI